MRLNPHRLGEKGGSNNPQFGVNNIRVHVHYCTVYASPVRKWHVCTVLDRKQSPYLSTSYMEKTRSILGV